MICKDNADARKMSSNLVQICEVGLEHPDMPDEVRLECPKVIFEKLKAKMDYEQLQKDLLAMNESLSLQLRVNLLKTKSEELMEKFKALGVKTEKGTYCQSALHVRGDYHLASTPEFKEGLFEVSVRRGKRRDSNVFSFMD